jgi:starch phosphorylase
MPTQDQGAGDVARAAGELALRLPTRLEPLARLAYNYRWSWLAGGPDLFREVDSERFELVKANPVRLLEEAPVGALARAAADDGLLARVAEAIAVVDAERAAPADDSAGIDPAHPVAFFCAEYGVHLSLPVYSGGLGALAGDLLKEASDRALPLVAVGLMYGKGYFRQRIDAGGWQHEYWIDTDPPRLPAALVTEDDGTPATITVPINSSEIVARIWRVEVGRVPLFLLDADVPDNGPLGRWITARLYEADPDIRLAQYALLGIGGVRALHALGIEPGVIHLNEGHAALAPLALGPGRPRTVFTTHTPVPAGNDSYPADEVERILAASAAQLDVPAGELIDLGRTHPGEAEEEFGMTQAALRLSDAANGVSERHGGVARAMWQPLWPNRSVDEVPIGHVTNGVHVPTWIGAPMRELLRRRLGDRWLARAADPEAWERVQEISDEELWAVRNAQRAELVEFVRARSTSDRLLRSDAREYVQAAARGFAPDVLTLGFARRVATYKRLDLLTRDPEWTLSLLGGDRPVQLVLAGKAHPRDDQAKRVLQGLFALKGERVVGERVVFLDDYDLETGRRFVQGCDVWLNLPRPPLEASGTSGMKSAINGGLQLSVLDGWWAEAWDGTNGWALPGDVEDDPDAQDARDSAEFHRLLEHEILPAFYDRNGADDPPRAWLGLMRASLRTLGPRFSATRMLADYVRGPYRGS